ncbi:MAG: Spy/CpxP family protein refolding chaperone [Ferruginibacter sp.]
MITKPNKSKPLVYIIVLLLLANIAGMIFNFVLLKKDDPHGGGAPMDRKAVIARYLKEDLKFTDAQLAEFNSLSDKNKTETEPLFDSLRAEKEKRMKFLVLNNFSDSALEHAVNRSSERQKALDLKMLTHIRNIRALCTDAQRASFDTGFFKMMERSRPERKNKKPTK